MLTYIVWTPDGFLYCHGSGVSHTDDREHAGHFANVEDAHVTAQLFGYLEGRYQVIPLDLNTRRSFREFLREMET